MEEVINPKVAPDRVPIYGRGDGLSIITRQKEKKKKKLDAMFQSYIILAPHDF